MKNEQIIKIILILLIFYILFISLKKNKENFSSPDPTPKTCVEQKKELRTQLMGLIINYTTKFKKIVDFVIKNKADLCNTYGKDIENAAKPMISMNFKCSEKSETQKDDVEDTRVETQEEEEEVAKEVTQKMNKDDEIIIGCRLGPGNLRRKFWKGENLSYFTVLHLCNDENTCAKLKKDTYYKHFRRDNPRNWSKIVKEDYSERKLLVDFETNNQVMKIEYYGNKIIFSNNIQWDDKLTWNNDTKSWNSGNKFVKIVRTGDNEVTFTYYNGNQNFKAITTMGGLSLHNGVSSFPVCVKDEINCNAQLSEGNSKNKNYRGCKNKTISGKTCQKWSEQYPQIHLHSIDNKLGLGDHNYCRNPSGEKNIWCYTTDSNTRWGYCYDSKCPNPPEDTKEIDTGCRSDYPYRTKHKKHAQENKNYCYNIKACAESIDCYKASGGSDVCKKIPINKKKEEGENCEADTECESETCRTNCCGTLGQSTGCTKCDFQGDCSTCSDGYLLRDYSECIKDDDA